MLRKYLKWLVLLLLYLPITQLRASDTTSLTFDVIPAVIQTWNGREVGKITYRIHVPVAGHAICTGWRYPVAQFFEDEWPQRRSCRTAERNYIEEEWGGPRFPLPYLGQYEAFVEDYSNDGKLTRITRKFMVIEGLPQDQ